jgi:hypothetical protein
VPTNLPEDAPQFYKGKAHTVAHTVDRKERVVGVD